MTWFDWFDKVTRWFGYVLGYAGAGVLLILMLISGIDVVGYYVFKHPLIGAYELSELAMASVVLLGWAYTHLERAHVDIDLVYNHLPPALQKVLDLFIPLLGLALFVFITWQSINFVSDSIGWHERTDMLHVPVWIFKLLISIGAVSISLRFVVDLVTAAKNLKGAS